MTKDNKDKEFYELTKKMYDHVQKIKSRAEPKIMNEEDSIRRAAQESALHFITDSDSIELGMMTLRKAYEIGYRAGVYAEQRKKDAV